MKKVKGYLGIIILVFVMFAVIAPGSKVQAAGTYKIRINKQQNCVTIPSLTVKKRQNSHKAHK